MKQVEGEAINNSVKWICEVTSGFTQVSRIEGVGGKIWGVDV